MFILLSVQVRCLVLMRVRRQSPGVRTRTPIGEAFRETSWRIEVLEAASRPQCKQTHTT
jgi:hypothetical protein